MDILKIRKKKAAQAAAKAGDDGAVEAGEDQASAGATTKKKKGKAASGKGAPSSPAPAATPPAAAPPAAAPPAAAPPAAAPLATAAAEEAVAASAPSAQDADPLREFLARYDDGAELLDEALEEELSRGSDDTRRFLAFELAGEAYAASIMDVREILRVVALTEVPRAPIEILGVLSKRGVVMPVVDLAATLGLRSPQPRYDASQRVLVVGEGDRVCGLRVDRVQEVIRLRESDIEEVPASLGTRTAHQLRGLGRVSERMFILLDVTAVLHGLAVTAGIETTEEL